MLDSGVSLPHRPPPRSCAEIDVDAFCHNLRAFSDYLAGDRKVMAVIKANAYGHGAVACANAALQNDATRVMVANCAEAAQLRSVAITAPIHLLGTLPADEVRDAVAMDLIPSIQEVRQARQISACCVKQQRQARVHLKVDSGMGRLGMRPEGVLDQIKEIMALPGICVEGIFSHLGCAADREFSRAQIELFDSICRDVRAVFPEIKMRHLCNTTGTVLYPEAHASGVRVGLGLYGMHDPVSLHETFPLKPVLSWRTAIHLIKAFPAGVSLGYNATFRTSRPSRIGILPIGYADGYPRSCSNRAFVLVRGQRVPVVGTISMDYTMVDLTDCPDAQVEDRVVLIGADGDARIRCEELAAWAATIPYCITCGISTRVAVRSASGSPGGILRLN